MKNCEVAGPTVFDGDYQCQYCGLVVAAIVVKSLNVCDTDRYHCRECRGRLCKIGPHNPLKPRTHRGESESEGGG